MSISRFFGWEMGNGVAPPQISWNKNYFLLKTLKYFIKFVEIEVVQVDFKNPKMSNTNKKVFSGRRLLKRFKFYLLYLFYKLYI